MASITISIEGAEQRYPLDTATVTLGRGLESDIRLKDIKASRRHCQILKTPKGWQCLDLNSGNGTYINGVQIKQQMLNPGDKIQIGSSLLTFIDRDNAPAAPAPAKALAPAKPAGSGSATAAAATVVAAPLAAAPPQKARSGGTSAGVPKAAAAPAAEASAASTRKATAVKAASPAEAAPRPGTKIVGRPGAAGPAKRPGALRGKMGKGPRPASARGGAEAGTRKKSPAVLILIIVGALVLAAAGYFFIFKKSGDPDAEQNKQKLGQLIKEARQLTTQGRIPEAIARYKEALALSESSERFKIDTAKIKESLQQLKADGDSAASAAGKTPDPKATPGKKADFQAVQSEISEKFKLNDKNAADWGSAIRSWTEFKEKKASDEEKDKVSAEIRALNQRARQELDGLRDLARRLHGDSKTAEAVNLLKQHRSRFEHTESILEFDKLKGEYDR